MSRLNHLLSRLPLKELRALGGEAGAAALGARRRMPRAPTAGEVASFRAALRRPEALAAVRARVATDNPRDVVARAEEMGDVVSVEEAREQLAAFRGVSTSGLLHTVNTMSGEEIAWRIESERRANANAAGAAQ